MDMTGYTYSEVTKEEIPEIIQFSQDNMQPEWRFCAGAAPYPNAELMQAYLEAGNPFVLARKYGEIYGYQIASRGNGNLLWGMAHRDISSDELDEGHAQLTALLWHVYGSPTQQAVPAASDENIADKLNAALSRALDIYNEEYA